MNDEANEVREEDLHAYIDGHLDAARKAEVEAYLVANPAELERVQAYGKQNDMLHALFDSALDEAVPFPIQPPANRKRFMPLLRVAAAAAWMAVGGTVGWMLHTQDAAKPLPAMAFAHQAAIAHVVYTPEVLHPVEVGADQEAHLVKWLSKRLGTELKPPHLGNAGYELVGGRLLPGDKGPAAQFMYQDTRGQRLTLYVRHNEDTNRETAFRYAQEGKVGVFYWIDGGMGYALSGEADKASLLKVANVVYQEFNP
jgi:anti-sigma factor RsiW